jgi:hypothetical protein
MADAMEDDSFAGDPEDAVQEPEEELDQDEQARNDLRLALIWIGFEPGQQVTAVAEELGSLKNLQSFNATDIKNMIKDGVTYGGNNRKLKFPTAHQKHLVALIEWVKDRKKINEPISLTSAGLNTLDTFISAIELAQFRKDIRTVEDKTLDAQ